MPAQLHSLRLLSALLLCAVADPTPGRVPKVYNALITSNQNLEPSKAYPVYQPVLHDAFGFSFQPGPVFYSGDFIHGNGLQPVPVPNPAPKEPQPSEAAPSSTPEAPVEVSPSSTEAPATTPEPPKQESDGASTPAPPLPPNTQSPIPLNEFGLPPQVLPIGHIDSVYNALPQYNPFAFRYPGVRFYDPFDPFGFNPYAGLPGIGGIPVYRPLTNVIGHSTIPVVAEKGPSVATPPVATPASVENSGQTPPSEPSDLNFLNYVSKDPAIPNVPPPLLPQGGLKSDKTE